MRFIIRTTLLLALFGQIAFTQIKECHITWIRGGVAQSYGYVNAGQTYTIERDPGTAVSFSVWPTSAVTGSRTYYLVDWSNGITVNSGPTTQGYWYFDSKVGSAATEVWLYVNSVSPKITISINNYVPPKPDLTVTSITFDGSTQLGNYQTGNTVGINARVDNNGSGAAAASYLGIYLGTNSSDYSNRIASRSVSALNGLTGTYVSYNYTFKDGDAGSGKYFLFKADYTNVVTNEADENNNTATRGTFTVTLAPPAAPTVSSATDVTQTGFTANWNSASRATGYRLDVAKDNGFTSFVSGFNNLDVGNVTGKVVSGLSPSTPYYYRVRAYNGTGTSGNSDTGPVTTAAYTGSLKITVMNIGGTSVPLPGANGLVKLFGSGGQQIGADQTTDANGVATFNSLAPGTGYSYKVYHNPGTATPFGVEYWGERTGVTVSTSVVNETFNRNQPYTSTIKLFDGSNEITGGVIGSGTQVTVRFTINNPSNVAVNARGRVFIDQSKSNPIEYTLQGAMVAIPANGQVVQSMTFSSTTLGAYYLAGAVDVSSSPSPICTDGGPWGVSPFVTVTTIAPSRRLDVPYYSQGDAEWCAPTSIAMMLKFWGIEKRPQSIAADLNLATTDGLNGPQIRDFLLSQGVGFQYDEKAIRLAGVPNWLLIWQLKNYIKAQITGGRPVLMGSYDIGHAFVVTGYDETTVYINDPSGYCLQILNLYNVANGYYQNELGNIRITWSQFENELMGGSWGIPLISSIAFAVIVIDDQTLPESPLKASLYIAPGFGRVYDHRGSGTYTFPHFTMTNGSGTAQKWLYYFWNGMEPFSGYHYMSTSNVYPKDEDNISPNVGQNATILDNVQLSLQVANASSVVFPGRIQVSLTNLQTSQSQLLKQVDVNIAPRSTNVYVPIVGTPSYQQNTTAGLTMVNQESNVTNGIDDDTDGLIDENLIPATYPLNGFPPGRYKLSAKLLDRNTSSVQSTEEICLNIAQPNVQGPLVAVKAFLQGPYSTGAMSTTLRTAGVIPLTQPYSVAPWSYPGSEAVVSIPTDVVDWVLIELRTGVAASTVVATRAAFIKGNGSIVDLDGTSAVRFASLSSGSYYVVVRHRNHLAVMSHDPVLLSETGTAYDFTTGLAQYYGGDAKDLGSGVFGLYAGDATGNGVVKYMGSGNDRLPMLTRIGGTDLTATASGYYPEDATLNGVVKYMGSGNDRLLIMTTLGGTDLTATKSTNVPN